VLPAPSALAAAAIKAILELSDRMGVRQQLAEAFHQVNLQDVHNSLQIWSWDQKTEPVGEYCENAALSCARYEYDNCKEAQVLFFSDLRPQKTSDPWTLRITSDQLARWAQSERGISLILIVFMTLGRGAYVSVEENERTVLALSVPELETIAFVESDDPLALPKFAQGSSAIRNRTRIHAFCTLDEFALYRSCGHGYYMSDQSIPDVISVHPGSGRNLVFDAQQRADRHGAIAPFEDIVVPVMRLRIDDEAPLYFSPALREISFLLEAFEPPVWVVVRRPGGGSYGELESLSTTIAEAVAFWLWKSAPYVSDALAPLATLFRFITL